MTAQNNDSAFSQVYIRSKNIQKVAKTVPKSPKNFSIGKQIQVEH